MKANKLCLITVSLGLIQLISPVIITNNSTPVISGTSLITTNTPPPATTLITTTTTTPTPATDTVTTTTPVPTIGTMGMPSSTSNATAGIISNTPTTPSSSSSSSTVTTPSVTPSTDSTPVKKNVLDADLNSKEINKNAPVISIKVGEDYTFNAPTDAEIFPDQEMLDTKKTTQKLDSTVISSVSSNNKHTITITGIRESRPDEEPYPIIVKKDGVHTTVARVRVVQK